MAKYRVYADYIATKIVGEVEANSKEEAIDMLREKAGYSGGLCYQCQKEFLDDAMLDDESFDAEEI